MTHKDIYTKFMIEYDKANVTSSYPSLTEYEVATVLDKAYSALIAQKVTGNNVRGAGFEGDNKAIADIAPLIKSEYCEYQNTFLNVMQAQLPSDMLYYISGKFYVTCTGAIDEEGTRAYPVKLVTHEVADKFIISPYNVPWVKTPVCYIEDNIINIVYDSVNALEQPAQNNEVISVTYIKKPNTFVKDTQHFNISTGNTATFFDYSSAMADTNIYSGSVDDNLTYAERYNFECSDAMAEELISLAVAFALENVESQRLNSKLNMRGLEA